MGKFKERHHHLAQDLPPAVLAPLLGLHIGTLVKWRRRAATD
ncbi:hypothetical protein ACFVUN_23020 [Kitasatospora griseola]